MTKQTTMVVIGGLRVNKMFLYFRVVTVLMGGLTWTWWTKLRIASLRTLFLHVLIDGDVIISEHRKD